MLPSDPADPADLTTVAGPGEPADDALRGDAAMPPTPVQPVPTAPLTPAVARSGSSARGPILALALVVVSVLAGGALFVSGYLVGQRNAGQPGTPVAAEQAFQPFWDSYDTIMKRFALGGETQQSLIDGAIKGMVDSLGDPYSAYLTPEQYSQGLQDLSGQFEGIGAEIGTKNAKGETSDCTTLGPDCFLVVVTPIEGSPSEKAGIKAGDTIVAVDGTSLDGLTVDGARNKIRGKKGTEVVLSVVRDKAAPVDIKVVRDVIVSKEVIDKDLAGGTVGYLKVTGFSDHASDAFQTALQADLKAGMTRIVLDLRGNPGGYVTAARAIASQFIKDGPLFYEEDASGKQEGTDATGNGIATSDAIKLVVLLDKGSASASEIVAGALQDRGRATIVGETSYGKGTVQQWIELQDGAALKLTVAKWLTPDKHWIHHVGIIPDVPVATPSGGAANADPALDKAVQILTGATASARPPVARAA
jgi:carboxyl-terminal processing protease